MPAGNFNEELPCPSAGNGVKARGPIQNLKDGDVVKELYVWVFQLQSDGTCAAATGELQGEITGSADGTAIWEVETKLQPDSPDPPRRSFAAGPAVAFAIAIFHTDQGTKQKVFWWGQNVTLT